MVILPCCVYLRESETTETHANFIHLLFSSKELEQMFLFFSVLVKIMPDSFTAFGLHLFCTLTLSLRFYANYMLKRTDGNNEKSQQRVWPQLAEISLNAYRTSYDQT